MYDAILSRRSAAEQSEDTAIEAFCKLFPTVSLHTHNDGESDTRTYGSGKINVHLRVSQGSDDGGAIDVDDAAMICPMVPHSDKKFSNAAKQMSVLVRDSYLKV